MTTQLQSTTASTEECPKFDILIIDDEPKVLRQIEQELIPQGFSLIQAASGEEALRILEHVKVSVAICDQKMPGGISGTEFLREARKKQPHLYGMILSAFGEPEHLLSAINEAQAFCYMLKPWDPQELVERVSQMLQLCYQKLSLVQQQEQVLKHTQTMLTKAILEKTSHKASLKENFHAFKTLSEVTGQMARVLEAELKREF